MLLNANYHSSQLKTNKYGIWYLIQCFQNATVLVVDHRVHQCLHGTQGNISTPISYLPDMGREIRVECMDVFEYYYQINGVH